MAFSSWCGWVIVVGLLSSKVLEADAAGAVVVEMPAVGVTMKMMLHSEPALRTDDLGVQIVPDG